MGLFDELLGSASEMHPDDVEQEFGDFLIENEHVEKTFKLLRDLLIFTNKRLLIIDKQGFSGKKMELRTVPYSSIKSFSVENAGRFDIDAELKLYVAAAPPLAFLLDKKTDIKHLNAILSNAIL